MQNFHENICSNINVNNIKYLRSKKIVDSKLRKQNNTNFKTFLNKL